MGFLAEIVGEIRASIARHGYLSEADLRRPGDPPASLRTAIQKAGGGGAVLVEFKRVSPGSETPHLPLRTAAEFVRSTEGGAPTAYSCIATASRFDGSPRDVADLTQLTPLPVLFKDFVVEPIQLEAAARAGASAVLLIARLETEGLLRVPLAELASGAHARGLEVLLEFHDKSELRRTANVGADMYGVNVRDLDTLRLEPAVADATIHAAGHLRPLLGLSGVTTAIDARRFWELGVDGILVGSAVARAVDPASFLRALHRNFPGASA
jgi:indole-3-glycerol phosphate synthase